MLPANFLLETDLPRGAKGVSAVCDFERLFLAVPRGCLRFVIVVLSEHTHLLFLNKLLYRPLIPHTRVI